MAPTIDVLMNAREVQRGARDVSKALDGVADAADAAARDGEKGTDKLERGLRDIVQAARPAERAYRDVGEEAKGAGRKAKDAGDDADEGFRKFRDAGEEASSELRQNLGETFSSFRGDLTDIGQIGQDVFGGLAGSVGGLVPAVGLAAGAAGMGLLIGAFELAEERRQQLSDRANDLANAYIEAGSNVMSAMSIAARTAEIITGEERDEALEYARVLGVDLPTAARAMAGDVNALAAVNAIAAQATRDAYAAADEQRESLKALTPEQEAKVRADLEAINKARELNGVVDEANQKFQDQQGVLRGLVSDADSAAVSVDALGNQVYELPDGTQIMINAETGQASTDVSNFKGDTDGVIEQLNNQQIKLRVTVDDTAWRNWKPGDKIGNVRTAVGPGGAGGTTWY